MDIEKYKKKIEINERQGCSFVEVDREDLRQLLELASQDVSKKETTDTIIDNIYGKIIDLTEECIDYESFDWGRFMKILKSILKEYGTAPVSRNEVLDEAIEAIRKIWREDDNGIHFSLLFDEAKEAIEQIKWKKVYTIEKKERWAVGCNWVTYYWKWWAGITKK